MAKNYNKNSNLSLFGGLSWIVIVTILLANTKALKHLEIFLNGNTIAFLFLSGLIFLPGALILAYGILLSESRQGVVKRDRVALLTAGIIIASLYSYGWVYLFVNGF